jgi:hypothetical protein
MTIYRCNRCRKQIEMERGHGGELCPVCETPGSYLTAVEKVSGSSIDRSLTATGALLPSEMAGIVEGLKAARDEARRHL